MPDPVGLPIHCPLCGKPFTVFLQLPGARALRAEPKEHVIECPYGCGATMVPKFYGEVTEVRPDVDESLAPKIVR